MSSFRNYSGGEENFGDDDDHKRSHENFNHGEGGKQNFKTERSQ